MISSREKERVKTAISKKLMAQPEVFGAPLRRSLQGYRRLRVGDYRAIFRIERQTVKIFYIGHRSVAYKEAVKRISR